MNERGSAIRVLVRVRDSRLFGTILDAAATIWCWFADSRLASGIGRAWRAALWRRRLQHFGSGSQIYPYVRINSPTTVTIGDHVDIAEFVHIWGAGGVTIGNGTIIAAHAIITSETHDPDAGSFRESYVAAPVCIGANCWIGSGAIVLPGVTIGEGSVIAAAAVVREDVAPGSIVAGVPARLVRMRGTDPR